MSYAIAAAGTGGHVFPALAVAEALVELGVDRSAIVFFGGKRFEATAVPEAGFELVSLDLAGLKRSLTPANLRLPLVVRNAARRVARELNERRTSVLLATGGYVTVPAGWGARQADVAFFVQEQNAVPGLANRVMSRWAVTAFSSFPDTPGLVRSEYVGNPVRADLAHFDRAESRWAARQRYGLDANLPTLGVVGGSLGAKAINEAVVDMVKHWQGAAFQIVHLTGPAHADAILEQATGESGNPRGITWSVVPFESDMHHFFAASDLLIARAGGMVSEITATATPAILIPGEFGSAGHQLGSAEVLTAAGAALTLMESDLAGLGEAVRGLLFDTGRLDEMAESSRRIGRPRAARTIAERMVAAHG